MKHFFKPTTLPAWTVIFGFAAQALRRLLYGTAVDVRGLLPSGHPLSLALGLLTLAVTAWILLSVRKLGGSCAYEDNFAPSRNALLGRLAACFGMLLTVLTCEPALGGYIGTLWTALGYAAPLCLMAAGVARSQGKKPFFLLDLAGCLFLTLHLICQYRGWSAMPQAQDYLFALFGCILITLFAFYTAAFAAGVGRRRMQLATGLLAVYFLIVELATTRYSWLYLGCILWVLTDLCSLEPKPAPAPETKPGNEA